MRVEESRHERDLVFKYDATGNRILKIAISKGQNANIRVTSYHRDAQGNVLSTEESDAVPTSTTSPIPTTREYTLYGSSRLGVFKTYALGTTPQVGDYYMTKTDKYYELTNHLGNVLAVIGDTKYYNATDGHYTTLTAQAQDYLPFGMIMPGRKYTNTSLAGVYRFGFQGQEEDPEWLDGAVSFKYRVQDKRIAKFLSVDPLFKNYPHNSQYAFAENDVIRSIDIEGKEKKIIVTYVNYGDTKTSDDDITIAQEVYKAHYNIFGFKQRDGDGYRYYLDNTASTYNKGVMTLFMRPEERKHRFKYEDDLFDSESIGQFSSSKIYGDGTLHLVADVTSGIAIGQYEKGVWDRFSSDVVDGYMVYAITDGSGYSGASRNVKSWQRLGDVKAIDFGSFITPKSAFQMNGKVKNFLEAVRNSVGTASNLVDLKTNYVDKLANISSKNKGVGLSLDRIAVDSICNSCTRKPHGLPFRTLDFQGEIIDTIKP